MVCGLRQKTLLEMSGHSQVAPLPSRATVALGDSKVAQTRCATLDSALMILDDRHGLFLGPRNVGLTPRRRSPRVSVLHKQVGTSDFAPQILVAGTISTKVGRVILAHIVLECVAVSVLRRLPS